MSTVVAVEYRAETDKYFKQLEDGSKVEIDKDEYDLLNDQMVNGESS